MYTQHVPESRVRSDDVFLTSGRPALDEVMAPRTSSAEGSADVSAPAFALVSKEGAHTYPEIPSTNIMRILDYYIYIWN